jgi:predicted transcriptional regulator
MNKRHESIPLAARERQIMDIVFGLGEASVSDVHKQLNNPPSYSAVRTMIRLLEKKGLLQHRQQGLKYIYRTTQSKQVASKQAMKHVVKTFFGGSPSDAVAALIDSEKLTESDLARIETLIQRARKEGR